MTGDPNLSARETMESLCRVFEERIRTYMQVLQLTHDEAKAIANHKTEVLNQVLQSKHQLLEEVRVADAQTASIRARWEEVREEIPEEDKAGLQGLHDQLGELLKSIIEQEKANEAALRSATGQVQGQLQDSAKRRAALNAYAKGSGGDPRFTDKKR